MAYVAPAVLSDYFLGLDDPTVINFHHITTFTPPPRYSELDHETPVPSYNSACKVKVIYVAKIQN